MKSTLTIQEGSNGGAAIIDESLPYTAWFDIVGTSAILFHRWNSDAVELKAKAAKGSKVKKEDNLESYVYRDEHGQLALPSEYFRMALVNAAKYRQDPRSPRKSAMDLFKAAVFPLDEMCSLGVADWNLVDRRRVQVQKQGITRSRPGLAQGWKTRVSLQVVLPEYLPPTVLNETMQLAGRVIGIADFRPTFGRFQVTRFDVEQ